MATSADKEALSFIREGISDIKQDISEMRKQNFNYMLKADCNALGGKCDERLKGFVTKTEYGPVKYVVFSLVMVILAQVVRMIVTSGVKL